MRRPVFAAFAVFTLSCPAAAQSDLRGGGKLLLTNGVSTLEGSAGGGLTPWATIAGNETKDGIGVQASTTGAELKDYDFRSVAIAIGIKDRIELSYTRQKFDTNKIGGLLGLGNDYAFDQDVWGAKLKLAGDMVYGAEMLPAIAIGVHYKRSLDAPIVRAVGARHAEGVDYYISATKLFLARSVLVNVTARATKANQMGLLGFGGVDDKYRICFEGSVAYQFSRRLALGVEFRAKPNNLAIAREDHWFDVFAAWALTRNLTITAAYADLGSIATVKGQRGALLQLQAGF